jgi:hypothetical protein
MTTEHDSADALLSDLDPLLFGGRGVMSFALNR